MRWIDAGAEYNRTHPEGERAVEDINFRSDDGRWIVCPDPVGGDLAKGWSTWTVWEAVRGGCHVRRAPDLFLASQGGAIALAEVLARQPARGFVGALRLVSGIAVALASRLQALGSLPMAFDRGLVRWFEAKRKAAPAPAPDLEPMQRPWADADTSCEFVEEADADDGDDAAGGDGTLGL